MNADNISRNAGILLAIAHRLGHVVNPEERETIVKRAIALEEEVDRQLRAYKGIAPKDDPESVRRQAEASR